jgi:hypothetical protein
MKRAILKIICLFLLLPANTAEARLGWTVLDAQQNYRTKSVLGKQGRAYSDSSIEIIFTHEGWTIHIAWFPNNDRAQYIKYTPPSGQSISKEQLDAILKANSDGKNWTFQSDSNSKIGVAAASFAGLDLRIGRFERDDGARTSQVTFQNLFSLSLKDPWLVHKEKTQREAKEEDKKRVPAF